MTKNGAIREQSRSNPSHIADNFNVFDFDLSDEDMTQISNRAALDPDCYLNLS